MRSRGFPEAIFRFWGPGIRKFVRRWIIESNDNTAETTGKAFPCTAPGTGVHATSGRHTRPSRLNDRHRKVIDFVVRRHWKTVYCYLRGKGYEPDQAGDLTQEFFLEIVLERDLVGQADPTKGQFRPFLLLALSRYLVDVRRRMSSRRRNPQGKLIGLDTVKPSRLLDSTGEPMAPDASDHTWLSELIERVLEHVEAEYHQKGKSAHWYVFHEHVLRPIVDQTDCPSLKEVGDRCSIDEATASNMIVTVKRRLRKLLAQSLRKLVVSDEGLGSHFAKISQNGAH
jgi:DNA-directed RNA polymerase specialized sigma24 family protein